MLNNQLSYSWLLIVRSVSHLDDNDKNNGPFPISAGSLYQNEVKCSVFLYGNDFSLSRKQNSFSQERLCTWPRFESEGFWNSEVACWCNKQNYSSARASRFLVHFFDVHCTTRNILHVIRRFKEDMNIRRRMFLSLFKAG